jgi:glycosyltransferase involved in cell wall biosynthesis
MRCPVLSQLPAPPRGKGGWPWTEESPQLPDAMPDGHPWPKISIVTPSYNQGRFVEETIRSVLLQGYPNLEYIIIDGGSSDGSVEIIKKYKEWLTYWVSEPDRGQSNAINKGFTKASGEIYSWLNSDDYLLTNALTNIAMSRNLSPSAGAWCGGSIRVKADGKLLGVSWPKRLDIEGLAQWFENHFAQSACFFSRKAWQKCGPLEQDLHYAMDFDLWLNIAKAFSIEKVKDVIAANHIHKDAKTQRETGRMCAEIFLVQIRHGYEHFAIQDISQWMNVYAGLMRKLDWIFRFPFFRWFRPSAQMVWKKYLTR